MQNTHSSARRKFFLRAGLFLLTFTALCVLLAAFTPPQAASAVLVLTKPPTATYGPSPTPEFPGYCGGFKVGVHFEGFQDGRPIFTITVTDQRDIDCDGIPNNSDNCDYTANPDQSKSDPNVEWGDACVPESGFRLNGRASEVIIYQMDNGSLHLYSPEGEKLGELSDAGMMQINPSLTVQQIMGRTYLVGYTDAAGQFRSTRFQSNGLTFSLMDIQMIAVTPPNLELRPGQTAQYFATGFHRTGLGLWFMPRWSATGGTINRQGLYTAGNVPGEYTVTACRVPTLCGSTTVRIVQ
jgi:hypothetical protein